MDVAERLAQELDIHVDRVRAALAKLEERGLIEERIEKARKGNRFRARMIDWLEKNLSQKGYPCL